MAKYKVTTEDGTYLVTTEDSPPASAGSPQGMPQSEPKPSLLQDIGSDYKDAIVQGPAAMLAKIPETAHKIASRVGDMAEQQLTKAGYNPALANVANNVISATPDIGSFMSVPSPVGQAQVSSAAVPLAQRALGFSKRFLNTPASRKAAQDAARVALEEGVIPLSGSTDEMAVRANSLAEKAGQKLGDIRDASGEHPVETILNDLDSLRASAPSRNSMIHSKIDKAKELFAGLLESVNGQKAVGSSADKAESAGSTIRSLGNSTSPSTQLNPATGLEEIVAPGTSRTVVGGEPYKGILGGNENPAEAGINGRPIVGGKTPDMMGGYAPPEKFSLKTFEKLKKELADSVNWLSDNATQSSTKKIVSRIEQSIEDLVGKSGQNLADYKQARATYGAAANMKKAINNELAAQQGNNAFSLPSTIMAAGQLAAGDPIRAIATLGLAEGAKRRGMAFGANAVNFAAQKALPLAKAGSLGLSAAANRLKTQ